MLPQFVQQSMTLRGVRRIYRDQGTVCCVIVSMI
jgi:hypothetical protein